VFSNQSNKFKLKIKGVKYMINKRKQEKEKKDASAVVAGVTGAAIGIGIAVAGAAAVVLNDKKNRQKIKEVLTQVKDQAVNYMEDVQSRVQDKKSEVGEGISAADKIVTHTKKVVAKAYKEGEEYGSN
jgi:shikimate 5-dehydrogenase